jgi:hypothetical protein
MDSCECVWSGKISTQSSIRFAEIDLRALIKSSLSRVQLQSIILLHQSNPQLTTRSLIMFVLLNERDCSEPGVRQSYGIFPAAPLSPRDGAKMACRNRQEVETAVLDLIKDK